jgi:hypothetical protein
MTLHLMPMRHKVDAKKADAATTTLVAHRAEDFFPRFAAEILNPATRTAVAKGAAAAAELAPVAAAD